MSEDYDPFFDSKKDKVRDNLENWFQIETDDILKEYSHSDIKIFVYDLFLSFNILNYIDKLYGQGESNKIDSDIKKYKNFIKEWNKKYRDVILDFIVGGIECKLEIFLDCNIDYASKLISRMYRYLRTNKSSSKLVAVFKSDEGENTLNLQDDKKMMKMIFLKEDMLNPKSPEFRLCTYFAMKNGFKREIDLQKYANEFSFDIDDSSDEGWNRRYPGIEFKSYKRTLGG